MVVKRRRKSRLLRGRSRYCGYGPNKNRGSGQRGGVGRAGSGKKCDAKKTRIWGNKSDYFGTAGFVARRSMPDLAAINLRDLQDKLETWLDAGLVDKEKDVFVVDLARLGYDKLLAAGKVVVKMKITVPNASAKVEEKLSAAGGELVK